MYSLYSHNSRTTFNSQLSTLNFISYTAYSRKYTYIIYYITCAILCQQLFCRGGVPPPVFAALHNYDVSMQPCRGEQRSPVLWLMLYVCGRTMCAPTYDFGIIALSPAGGGTPPLQRVHFINYVRHTRAPKGRPYKLMTKG